MNGIVILLLFPRPYTTNKQAKKQTHNNHNTLLISLIELKVSRLVHTRTGRGRCWSWLGIGIVFLVVVVGNTRLCCRGLVLVVVVASVVVGHGLVVALTIYVVRDH